MVLPVLGCMQETGLRWGLGSGGRLHCTQQVERWCTALSRLGGFHQCHQPTGLVSRVVHSKLYTGVKHLCICDDCSLLATDQHHCPY